MVQLCSERCFENIHTDCIKQSPGNTTDNRAIELGHNDLHCDAILHERDARRPVSLPDIFTARVVFPHVWSVDLPDMACCSVKYLWCLLPTDFYCRLGQTQLYEHSTRAQHHSHSQESAEDQV